MDYRYEIAKEGRDLHRRRNAFIVIDKKIYYLIASEKTHWEFCQETNISKEKFNQLTRGYYIDGNIVFYKGNFIYDQALICDAM